MPSSATSLGRVEQPGLLPADILETLRPAPDARGEPLIETRGLMKSYGPNRVIDDVSLSIREGETVALIGHNGAGKSTLLKTLIGLRDSDAGTVDILGETFRRQPDARQRAAIRRQVGFVFQQHGLVMRLSALSNVIHGRLGQPGAWRAWHQAIAPALWRDEAMAALDAVRLAHKADARADQLSGGQAQRIAIARALVRKPRVFIADEPAASLDPAAAHEVMQTFAAIAEETKTTLVFTTHDMGHALNYARRVVGLKHGHVCLDAESRNLNTHDLEGIFRD